MVAILQGYPTRFGAIRWRQLRRKTQSLLDRFDIKVDPEARAAFLSAAERALVTLAIALGDTGEAAIAPMVVLDEATASVPAEDAKLYLDAVRAAAQQGGGVLMVSHRLQEIIDYCDSVTVLSDGRVVYDGTISGLSVRELSEYMARDVGGERASRARFATRSLPASWGFEQSDSGAADAQSPPVLRVVDLRGPMVRGVSLTVRSGEIVGLSGLFGSGVSEVGRLIAGIETTTDGIIQLDGNEPLVLRGRVHKALNSGIAYLSSDRAHEGGIATLSMQENALLPTVSRYWGKKVVERMRIAEAISLLDVRPRDPLAPFGLLSGGNQQKILVAKILLTCPRLVVLDDPTVGVDPHSREIIFAVLREVVESGRGALISSSEPDQLARICDRVLIIDRGRITRELAGNQVTATNIMLASA
jgi:ribose transport system ATP-binding protein